MLVALIAQWLERELRRRRSWVQSTPHQTERVRGQSTQSLWRITCPPPEQTPRTCRKDPLGQKRKENDDSDMLLFTSFHANSTSNNDNDNDNDNSTNKTNKKEIIRLVLVMMITICYFLQVTYRYVTCYKFPR